MIGHRAHLAYSNPSQGQHHFRAFCSCGFATDSSDQLEPVEEKLAEHTSEPVERDCVCWK